MGNTLFKLKDHCSFVALPGEGLILDPEKRVYYRANGSAALLLNAFYAAGMAGGGIKMESLVDLLKSHYLGVNEKGIATFLKQLQDLGLIETTAKEAELPSHALHPFGITALQPFIAPNLEPFAKPQPMIHAFCSFIVPIGPHAVFPKKLMRDNF